MGVRYSINVRTTPELEAGVYGLALIGLAQMRDPANRGRIPPLYSGRVRYQREPPGEEEWLPALDVARRGEGDCEDLAAYRTAELHLQGETQARPVVLEISPTLRHVVVRRASGAIEDPSKQLGMKGRG